MSVTRSVHRSLARIRAQLPRLREIAALPEERLLATTAVSGWCPAEHVDHMVKVSSVILERLTDSEATNIGKPINLIGRLILAYGRIPRGKGKAPSRVAGKRCNGSDLSTAIDVLQRQLEAFPELPSALAAMPLVPHPRFGGLNASQALRFIDVHNDHHLRIVADVLRTVDKTTETPRG